MWPDAIHASELARRQASNFRISVGITGIRKSGFPEIRKNVGFPEIPISGYPEVRISRFPDIRISRYPNNRNFGFPKSRISGFPTIWIPGFRISGISDFQKIRISGFQKILVSGVPGGRTGRKQRAFCMYELIG